MSPSSVGTVPPWPAYPFRDRAGRALAQQMPSSRSTPDIRVIAVNSTQWACASSPGVRARSPYCCLANTTMERPSGVSSARLDSCAASASCSGETPDSGTKSAACRLPRVMVPVLSSSSVLTSPAASTARPDIASTLRCTSRSMPAMPMADSSAPIVVGMRHTSSDTITMPVTPLPVSARRVRDAGVVRLGVDRQRLQGRDREHEDDRQRGQQDVQRDLVGRLLPVGALDERDHPVDEALARLLRDLDDDAVRQHGGAAGDRRAVATGFADDRRRLAGDRRFIHRRNAFHHVAVTGDDLAGLDDDDVALLQQRCGDLLFAPGGRRVPSRSRRRAMVAVLALRSDSACALPRPSATASARLAKTTVSQSQTTISHANQIGSTIARTVLQTAPISTMNMTGLRHSVRGSSLRSASGIDFHSIFGSSRPPWTRRFRSACVLRADL